jgi:hypothetical protein
MEPFTKALDVFVRVTWLQTPFSPLKFWVADGLRSEAILFLRLFTRPPLRPFSRLARLLAALRTKPPNRPRATA